MPGIPLWHSSLIITTIITNWNVNKYWKKLEFFLSLTFLKTAILSHNHKYILSRNYFYTKVIWRAETSLYGQHNPEEKEPSLCSMFYEDSPKGNRKDWRSHPRRTKGSVWADSRLDSLHLRSLRTLFHWDIGKLCVHNIWRASNSVYEGNYKVLLWCCFWLFPSSAMLTCCCGYWKYAILRV